MALKCSGGTGPSGLNAQGAERILCSESFGNWCNDLCGALATFTRKLATTNTDIIPILPFLSCRMMGLDKNPGIRPVEIGEIFRRIVTAALLQNFRGKTQNPTGPIRPVEVPEAELKQQYKRWLDYLITAQRNVYYSLMQTTPSTVSTVRRHCITYHSSVLNFQHS